jgi:hypothetical protein
MPTISAGDLTKLRDQSPYNAIVEWYLAVAPYGDAVFTAQVNGSVSDPNMTIPYDNGVGEVKKGMTLWVGSTAGARDLGKVRVRADASGASGNLDVAENYDIEWADDVYLTAPGEGGFREIWSKYQRLDDDGTVYKDYDVEYGSAGDTNDPGENIPPKANAGTPVCAWLNDSGYVDVDFIAEDSYAVGAGETLTYSWDFDDGAVQSWGDADHIGTPASPNVVRFSNTGFRYVELTVTSSNGEHGVVYVPVWIFDEGTVDPIKVIEMRGQEGSIDGGWTATIAVRDTDQDVIYDFPEGALVVLFTRTWYGGNEDEIGGYHDRENVRMVGWIREETFSFDHATGEAEFQIVSHDQRLRRLFGFGFTVQDTASPDEWHEIKDLNVDRAIQWHHTWHTTVNSVCHVEAGGEGSSREFHRWICAETNLFDQVQSELAVNANYYFTSDRQGILRITQNPQYQLVASRDAAICSLVQSDWRNQITARRASKSTGYVKIGGFIPGGSDADYAKLSWAPGDAPVQAPDELDQEGFIVQDVDELKQWSGMMLANKNNPFPEVTIELRGYWPVFDPAYQEFIALTADDPHDRRDWSAARFIPRRVAYHDRSEDATCVTELVLEKETDGPPGVEKTVPDLPDFDLPDLDPITPPPPPPPPSSIEWPKNFGAAIAFTSGELAYTDAFGVDASWHDIGSGISGGIRQFLYVQFSGGIVSGWVQSSHGLYWADNVLTSSPSWSLVISNADMAAVNAQINGAGYAIHSHCTDPNKLIVMGSTPDWYEDHYYMLVTSDRGGTWSPGMGEHTRRNWFSANYGAIEVDENTGDIYTWGMCCHMVTWFSLMKSVDGGLSYDVLGHHLLGDRFVHGAPHPHVVVPFWASGVPYTFWPDGGIHKFGVGDVTPGGASVDSVGYIEAHTFTSGLLWANVGNQLFKTTDGAASWDDITPTDYYGKTIGLQDTNFGCPTGWPGDDNIINLMSRTSTGRIGFSDDGGVTWWDAYGDWHSVFGAYSGGNGSMVTLLPRVGANAE